MQPSTFDTSPRSAAQVSFIGSATFFVLVAFLHAIEPEIDPSWRFISEYALGDHGWLMNVAFFAWAVAHVALVFAVKAEVRNTAGRIGLALLLVNALGILIAAVFPTDPVTASASERTTAGALHAFGGSLGMAMPFAIGLISWSLVRHYLWFPARHRIVGTAILAGIGFLVSLVSIGVMLSQSSGRFGPDVPVGWPNRFEVLTYTLWLMVVAWHPMQTARHEVSVVRPI